MDCEVINVDMGDEFKVCPSCGYKDGLHSMFRKEADATNTSNFINEKIC